jgi:hypothetical protein
MLADYSSVPAGKVQRRSIIRAHQRAVITPRSCHNLRAAAISEARSPAAEAFVAAMLGMIALLRRFSSGSSRRLSGSRRRSNLISVEQIPDQVSFSM